MNMPIKILTNVFLNSSENEVVPVNIYFNEKIKQIEILSNNPVNWSEISSTEKKNKFIKSIKYKNIPSNYLKIDGNFDLVIPGAIDPHVHFDTPGFEFRDTFENGTCAAAAGGVTTIIDMPCTSLPPVTSLNNFQQKLKIVKNRSLIDFAFWGGIRRNDFDANIDVEKNVNELNEAGVASYKAYLISGMDTFKDLSLNQMELAAKYVKRTGKPLGVHAEDKELIEIRRKESQDKDHNNWMAYCNARDSKAEQTAVINMVGISKKTGAKIHIVHLSSELGLISIVEAQRKGINITAETCSHYLQFTQRDFNNHIISKFLKTAPPVKNDNDKLALWEGLENGIVHFLTTDHAGCDPHKEKISNNFWEVYGGIPGVEHRVPHLFSEGFRKNKLSLENCIRVLSKNVAEYFNLPGKGQIKENYDADFALINLWESEIVRSENMHSKGKYTPFEGMKFNSKVDMTILRGNIIKDHNGTNNKQIGYGEFIEVH